MAVRSYPGIGVQGPVPADDSLAALATLLGVNADKGGDPGTAEFTPGSFQFSGEVPTQGELSSPFEQEQSARATAADTADRARTAKMQALSDFFLPEAKEQRQEALNTDLAKAGEPARIAGEYGLGRERIAQEGGIERQQIANQGLIGAAQAKASASTGARLPSGLMERVAGAQTSLKTLDQLEALFPKVKDSAFFGVGPASGRIGTLLQKLPLAPSDPNFNTFTSNSSILANAVIKAITGAQMSEPEAERLMNQIPSVTDKPELWTQKAQTLRQNLTDTINNIQNLNHTPSGPAITSDRLRALAAQHGVDISDDDLLSLMQGASPGAGANSDLITDPNWGL